MKKILTLATGLLLAFFINAQIIVNGDFETWTSNTPDSWTTIESGISVSQETSIVHGGSSAMNVWVTTASQGFTDFRQDIAVLNGHIYDISLWVYQLDSASRVTIFIDGIWTNQYSVETTVGSWQEVTYQYTATADATVPVGLRFYDVVPTFIDSSNMIIDDFTMVDVSGTGTNPYITNININPSSPTNTDPVDVFADITDDGTIVSAYLYWGTDGISFADSINMSVVSGNTYQTDTPIPAQVSGTYVYYYIIATDDSSETATSLTFVYVIPYGVPFGECQNLFFSEYIEGTAFNKVLEIYNPTSSIVDLSNYSIQRFNNGNTVANSTFVLSGTLNPGETYVMANPQADSLTIQIMSDTLTSFVSHNGNDTYVLYNYVDTIDIFGQIGLSTNFDIDTVAGAAADYTLIRKSTIHQGQTNWNAGTLEWDIHPLDYTGDLGTHTITPCNVSISESIAEDIVVYPNPVNEILHVDNLKEVDYIQINDMLCQTVYINANFSDNNFKYNTSKLEKGIYILNIIFTDNSYKSYKFIKN